MGLGKATRLSITRPLRTPDDDPLLDALRRSHAAQAPMMNSMFDLVAQSGVIDRIIADAVAAGTIIHAPAGAMLWDGRVYGLDEIAGEGEI